MLLPTTKAMSKAKTDLPAKVQIRTPLYFGDMLAAVERGFGCTRAQAADIIDDARRLGVIVDNPLQFTLQIIENDQVACGNAKFPDQ